MVDFAGFEDALWRPPAGWYRLGAVPDAGHVLAADLGSIPLVAWADGDEVVAAIARCPHLGADLSRGGVVDGDGCLTCPFHGWRYGTDGSHRGTPSGAVVAGARLDVLTTRVVDGVVYAFHPAGAGSAAWEPLVAGWARDAAEIAAGTDATSPPVVLRRPTPAPPVIVAEGAFDLAHFGTVHGVEPTDVDYGFEGAAGWIGFTLGTGRRAFRFHFDLDGLTGMRETVRRDRYALVRTIWHEPTPEGWFSRLESAASGPQPRAAAALARELDRAAADDYLADEVIWAHRAFAHPSVYGPADRALRDYRAWALGLLDEVS